MLQEFGNAFAFIALAAVLPLIILFISKFLRPDYPHAQKLMTYECGEVPQGSAYVMFNPRFYMVAIVFLVFDVEVALLFPVMSLFRESIFQGYAPVVFLLSFGFLFILLVGLIYEWKTGDIDWVRDFADRRHSFHEEGAPLAHRNSVKEALIKKKGPIL